MLLNSPSEQEIALKKQKDQAWIDSILEKAFPMEQTAQKEPYLNYEDLLDKPKTLVGESTGMGAPIKEEQVVYERRLTPYEEIDTKKDWTDDLRAQKIRKVINIFIK